MKIEKLRTNHIENPLCFWGDRHILSWVVVKATGKKQKYARIRVSMEESMAHLLYDSGERKDITSLGFELPLNVMPCSRYYWTAEVGGDDGETGKSAISWFETGKGEEGIEGQWIASPFHPHITPAFFKKIFLSKEVATARVYATALGVFEFYANGEKVGDEFLAPFCTDYNNWLQYVAYDITDYVHKGENAVGTFLGNGWYKGRFGFIDKFDQLYGSRAEFLAEIVITYEDGSMESIGTDTQWLCAPSQILENSIYDGEKIDANLEIEGFATKDCCLKGFLKSIPGQGVGKNKITPRLSPYLRIKERIKPERILHTKKGEIVLDFGQVMTGWVEFYSQLEAGKEILLEYGELLQEECFYNENLRTAKQQFCYCSNGKRERVRPHFTFYGFRYVKLTGVREPNLDDYMACVLHSDIEETGWIETSDEKVNQLVSNTKWGQKGNFVDIPTDCPQRDERMGWTGDAQAFCATASFHMHTPGFYRKYMRDMYLEQKELNGSVPHVIPNVLGQIRKRLGQTEGQTPDGSCAWGDAATVIPFTMHLFYGDVQLLEEQYDSMRRWVNYIRGEDVHKCNNAHLWKCGFHFADWLALDNPDKDSSLGGTDSFYVASAYYYYSARLTSMAATALGKKEDAASYNILAEEVKKAFHKEYFDAEGNIKLTNQTALVMALYFDLVPEGWREKAAKLLQMKLEDNGGHLDTGFVGTAYICSALSEVGLNGHAYTLLLNQEYPGWLYEVNMGATTVWERWNSILPDGTISDTGMNSMNHYAYGAVAEWMYRCVCGINPVWEKPGFKKAKISMQPDQRLQWVKAIYHSASGCYKTSWEKKGERIVCKVTVPFDAEAEFHFPKDSRLHELNGKSIKEQNIELDAGDYELSFCISL